MKSSTIDKLRISGAIAWVMYCAEIWDRKDYPRCAPRLIARAMEIDGELSLDDWADVAYTAFHGVNADGSLSIYDGYTNEELARIKTDCRKLAIKGMSEAEEVKNQGIPLYYV